MHSFLAELKDMKSGQPLYTPIDQTGSYAPQAVLYPQWSHMGPPQGPGAGQQASQLHHTQHHHMYSQGGQFRPGLVGFNHPMPAYMSSSHEGSANFVLPVPVQQLQQLQIAGGHPGAFCLMNPNHSAIYMATQQSAGQSQHDS